MRLEVMRSSKLKLYKRTSLVDIRSYDMSRKLIAIIGPTACGKTSLAIKIAKEFNGELINADSRQIYKYMDIGTAKGVVNEVKEFKYSFPTNVNLFELESVPIHLLNIVSPNKVFTLSQYQKLAKKVIKDIISRGKIPIIVGGTGLYIDAIAKNYSIPKVKPDNILRKRLDNLSVADLQEELSCIDKKRFESMNNSDINNPRRLIRAIEISTNHRAYKRDLKQGEYRSIFLMPAYTERSLLSRIRKRAKKMLNKGVVEEFKRLREKGYDTSMPALSANCYPIIEEYLNKKIDKEQLVESMVLKDRQYSKKQETWFKRYNHTTIKDTDSAFSIVNNFLKNS